ncbi:MAG: adenylosuccinate lyase [Anaerolineae bacterium]|jgi:adenylosuccinate lyase|nr:adenylosuccinate lyase [Anaerolineae bacterium]MBT7071323.1 adenylosuccinate lyase [Anaerolineae bacterium]MBT7324163.1 adenylosuccinate lyase [Anaerolineae bacterium]
MSTHNLLSLNPLDGRYATVTAPLSAYFSEFAYIRGRARVEIAYLIALSQDAQIVRPLTDDELDFLQDLSENFSVEDADEVKALEKITRHDVKAIENFLRARLERTSLVDTLSWLHFGLTSEDANLTSQAISLHEARDAVLLPALDKIIEQLSDFVREYASTPMLARTHGQPAVPTTFGKEMAVFLARLKAQREIIAAHLFDAKWSGAIGNYNAMVAAFPEVDWRKFGNNFLAGLGVKSNPVSTQLIPYDNWLRYFQAVSLANSILLDFAQDMWRYISDDVLKLRVVKDEVGSSTMPQKVNPIDFENAEGNLGIANALFAEYLRKLPVSRLQRDLSDSTVRRSFGTAFGHTLVAFGSITRGLGRCQVNEAKLKSTLDAHSEVVSEGAQTILRAAQISSAYDDLKSLTRGKKLDVESYQVWVNMLDVAEDVKNKLRALSPATYIGLAKEIAEETLID